MKMIHEKTKMRNFLLFASLLIFLTLQSCAPVFSELQTARTVGEGNIEVLPSYSTVSATSEGETNGVQNHIGLQVAYGITDRIDIRGRYERVWLKEDGGGNGNAFGIGPKLSILKDRISFYLPVGKGFGDDLIEGSNVESWQIHPTVLVTLPAIKNMLDVTLSPKALFFFCEDCEGLLATNLGLSFSTNPNKWTIRPEYGVLFQPGETGFYGQFSIGFSTTFGLGGED